MRRSPAPKPARPPRPGWGLLHLGPHDDAHWGALRAVITVGAPSAVLLATGHTPWTLFVVFGAFASLYGRHSTYRARRAMQGQAAVLLVAAVGVGTVIGAVAPGGWIAVVATALVGGTTATAARCWGWRPPGALFAVFAVGACATQPQSPGTVAVALGLAAGTAAGGIALGQLGALLPARGAAKSGPPARVPVRDVLGRRDPAASVAAHVLAPLVAGSFAVGLGVSHPSWAMVAAVAPLSAAGRSSQVARAVHRTLGTLVGVLVASALLALDPPPAVVLGLVLVLQAWAELFVTRHYGVAVAGITPMALLMGHLAAPAPVLATVTDRGVETLVGVVVAVAAAAGTQALAAGGARGPGRGRGTIGP